MSVDTGCGSYFVLGKISKNVYILDEKRTGLFEFPQYTIDLGLTESKGIACCLKTLLTGDWDVYTVNIGNKNVDPVHYVAGSKALDLYIDINGVIKGQKIIDTWGQVLSGKNIRNNVEIREVDFRECLSERDRTYIDLKIVESICSDILNVLGSSRFKVLKVIKIKDHPFYQEQLPSFFNEIDKPKLFLNRIKCNYEILSKIGVGPTVETILCDDALVVIMQFLPIGSNPQRNRENSESIKQLVKKAHGFGIIHGDLHAYNMAYDKNMRPYYIDADTMFFEQDTEGGNAKKNKVYGEWIKSGFDKSIEEYKAYEEETSWK